MFSNIHPDRLVPVLALLVLALLCVPQSRAQEIIDYNHRALDCEYLAREYDRIMARAEDKEPYDTSIDTTRLKALPFFIITGQFNTDLTKFYGRVNSLGGAIHLSGNLEDLATAARKKNCYHLYDRFVKQQEAGQVPPPAPVRSLIGTGID